MKKIVVLLVALMLIAAAAFFVGVRLVTPPTANALELLTAPAPNDFTLAVENRLFSPCIYTVDKDGVITDVYRTERMSGGYQAITSLCSEGELVYYTRQALDAGGNPQNGWSVWKYDSTSHKAENITEQPGIGMVKGIAKWQDTIWVTTQDSEDALVVYEIPAAGGAPKETEKLWLPEGKRMLQASYTAEGKLVVLLDNGTTMQTVNGLFQDSTNKYPYETDTRNLTTTNGAWVQLYLSSILIIFAIMLAIVALPVPLILMCLRAKKLLHRVWAVSTLGVLATSLIAIIMLVSQTVGVLVQSSNQASFVMAERVAKNIGKQNPVLMPTNNSATGTKTADFYSLIGAQDDILAVQNGTTVVAVSSRLKTGSYPNYDEATSTLVQKALQGTNGTGYSIFMGKIVSISAFGVSSKGELTGVLVSRNAIDGFSGEQTKPILWLAGIATAALALLTLALRLMLGRVTAPIAKITNKMEAISAGDISLWNPEAAHDELDGMCRAMQEMCMSLAIRDYEVDSTISAYRRFVPMGLNKLLDRASIQEVTTGDVRTITGAIGLLSVNNRDKARALLSDDQFVHFVNGCCNTLSKNLEEHGGYLLSSAFDLTSSKIFFDGADNGSIAAGLALTSGNKQSANEVMIPSFSLIMHHTGLLYGIAGGKNNVFPFISSVELDFLQSYNEMFCQTGVRLVLTEKLVETLGVDCQMRYIGFIASDDEKYSYKLYEALNMYSDTQYNNRFRYDDRLQEGIQLFYRSDFYLARSVFSSLLRMAPDDGIVRWYLFACEYYFNRKEHDSVDLRLFGIDNPNK